MAEEEKGEVEKLKAKSGKRKAESGKRNTRAIAQSLREDECVGWEPTGA